MSWSYRIIIVFILFFTGLGVMVYIAMRQTNDMVEENYYDKELKYQEVIDAKKNFQRFNDSVHVATDGDFIIISLPPAAIHGLQSGVLQFIRPSAKAQDKNIVLQPGNDGVQRIPKKEIATGYYHVKAIWKAAGINYFDERNVLIR